MALRIVFYSWQSDLPPRGNRTLIEDALTTAARKIARDETLDIEPRVDSDTKGLAGSPDIAEAIFMKIQRSEAFVADVTPIDPMAAGMRRRTPNPNVLVELGFAAKSLGWERVIMVLNTAYAELESLPFDLRARRILKYAHAGEEAPGAVRSQLASQLEVALREVLATRSPAEERALEAVKPEHRPSVWVDYEHHHDYSDDEAARQRPEPPRTSVTLAIRNVGACGVRLEQARFYWRLNDAPDNTVDATISSRNEETLRGAIGVGEKLRLDVGLPRKAPASFTSAKAELVARLDAISTTSGVRATMTREMRVPR